MKHKYAKLLNQKKPVSEIASGKVISIVMSTQIKTIVLLSAINANGKTDAWIFQKKRSSSNRFLKSWALPQEFLRFLSPP